MGITKGKITDVQMFNRLLTADEMIAMTTCDGAKLIGNILNSTVAFTILDPNVQEIDIYQEEICPVRNFSAVFFRGWHWNFWGAQRLCNKIGMEVAFVANEKDKANIFFYFNITIPYYDSWIQTLLYRDDEDAWVNINTNETTILPWGENYPSKSKYGRIVVKMPINKMHIENQGLNFYTPVLCTADYQKAYQQDSFVSANYPFRLFVKILGLCSSSLYDYRYVFDPTTEYVYIARYGGELK